MSDYNLTLPSGVNDFQFDQKTFKAGDSYHTDDPCQAIAFYNAAKTTNPEAGRADETKNFWSLTDKACQAQVSASPPPPPPVVPVEGNPGSKGDTAVDQGAPPPPNNGTVKGKGDKANQGGQADVPPSDEPRKPPAGDPHPNNGGEQPQTQTDAGDPADLFQGAFYLVETDLTVPNTIMPLSFTRFYRSGAASYGPFGWNWDHNFNLYLRELSTGDMALWRNLHEDIFKFDGSGFEPPRGVFEKLTRVSAIAQVYELAAEGGVVMRFERPPGWIDGERIPLLWIKDQHGNLLSFSYGAEDKLAEVRDDDDRFFQFEYDLCGLLVALTDHAGRKFLYEHDEQTMQLTCVTSPPISDHPDGITKIFHYEQPWTLPELRHNIVRVEDSEGRVYVENTYEQDPASWSFARLTEQIYGGFLYQFQYTQLQWVPANPLFMNIASVRVEVMNPDFGLETYTFNYRGDLLDRRYRLSKDHSFRVAAWLYEFDEQGNLAKSTRPDGSEEINTFDFLNADPRMRGKLLKKEITAASGFPAPSRIVWKGKYEATYQLLIEEKNETNATTTYKYDFDITPAAANNTGKLKQLIQPNATLPDGTVQTAVTQYEHNAIGQVTATILPDGVRNEFEYGIAGNEKNRLVKQLQDVASLGILQKAQYDAFGFISETTDGNGHISTKVYNALGMLEKIILAPVRGLTAEYVFHYDSDKKLVLTEKPKGSYRDPLTGGNAIIDQVRRDVLGYPLEYSLSSNSNEARVLSQTNDYRGSSIETINPDGSKFRNIYDERGLPLREEVIGSDGLKITSEKVYDRSGRLIQETSPFGLITKYEYDGFARISKILLPNGTEIRNRWLQNDLLESEETIGDDGTGVIRQLSLKTATYDEKSRKITGTVKSFIDNPAVFTNIITTYFYDAADRVERIITHRGGISSKSYDGLGRVILDRDAMGNEEHFQYDQNSNVLQTDSHHIEPDGSVSVITRKFKYDSRNRRIELTEPDGANVISEYDDRNLLVKQTDHLGIITESFFNTYNDKIQEVKDAGGLNITHRWTVDAMSRVTSYMDPTGQVSNYVFDSIGRNYRISYPNGFTSTKMFNSVNQVVKEKLGSGVEFEYMYDASGRMSRMENTAFPVPILKADTLNFAYDGLDRLIAASSAGNQVLRKFDSIGRLLEETTHGNTLSCRYIDATGAVEKIWPDGRTEKLSHNLNGALTQIEETVSGALGSGNNLLASFETSGPSTFGEATYPGGAVIKNIYDERKRLTEIIATSPAGANENIKYRYNRGGTMQVEALLGQNPKLSYFDFDNKRRLLNAKDQFMTAIPAASTQLEHDAAINLVQAASAAAAHEENYLYDLADGRTKYSETAQPDKNYIFSGGHQIQSDGVNNYNYHIDGSLENDGILSFEADALGRIIRIKSGLNIITEITYDALGRPGILKETGKPDRSFNYLGAFIEQENENGAASRQISVLPLTGTPIAYHSAAATHYSFFDARLNLAGIFDDAGLLLETYRYQSFGKPQVFDAAGNPIPASAFGVLPVFGGQRYLDSSGLYLSRRRLMDPVNGVYLSADSKGYIDSPALYVYTAQDPINNFDPNGEFLPILAAFVIGGLIAGSGYSIYDNIKNPEKYRGGAAIWRPVMNVLGGGLIGGTAFFAGEVILGLGGTGALVTGAGSGAVSLTALQTFVLYGTASATTGAVLRGGFNSMFPEYVNPITPGTMATDYAAGGAFGLFFRGIGLLATSGKNTATWTLQGDREAILESKRLWGQTEGSVYGMNTPNLPTLRATGGGKVGPDSAIFEFSGANNIFNAHEITGPFSLIKRLLGQSKAGFGDIAFDEATQIGVRMVKGVEIPVYNLTGVRLLPGEFAGQSASFAAARLWGRRTLDAFLTAGFLAAMGLNVYDSSGSPEVKHPNDKPHTAK